jgi:hypothetical protein
MKTFAGVCLVTILGLMIVVRWGLGVRLSDDTLQICGAAKLFYLLLFGCLHLNDKLEGW